MDVHASSPKTQSKEPFSSGWPFRAVPSQLLLQPGGTAWTEGAGLAISRILNEKKITFIGIQLCLAKLLNPEQSDVILQRFYEGLGWPKFKKTLSGKDSD